MSAHPARRLLRASVFGLAAALGLAAVALGFLALQQRAFECRQLAPNECAFERELHSSSARQEGLGALACTCVALGLLLFLGRRPVVSRDADAPR